MKMQLIDADALKEEFRGWLASYNDFRTIGDIIDEAHTIDAEPVVRCKECKHYRDGICEKIEYIMDGYYHGTFEEKRPDDFCSYGEKMERGAE